MSKVVTIQTDFTAGELSPRLLARTDLDLYKKGTKTFENMICLPHGGSQRAPGFIFVDELYDSTQKGQLFRFVYSRSSAYLIVMNGGQIQFIKDRAFITTGSPATRYQITCPYSEAELPFVKKCQVGTKVYFTHPDHPPKVLNRIDDTNWTLTDVAFVYNAVTEETYSNYWIRFKIIRGTVDFEKADSFTINSSTGAVTAGTNTGNGTIAKIEIDASAPAETWTVTLYYKNENIQEWTVSGSVSGTMIVDWHTNTYPAAVAVFQQRLYFGGTLKDPQKIWGSRIGDYVDLTRSKNDNDGIQLTPDSGEFDQIVHLVSTLQLLPLSYSTEYSITGGSAKGITPTNYKLSSQTNHGADDVVPIKIGNQILFVPRGQKSLRAIGYSITEDVNLAPDVSIYAEHLLQSGIKDQTFAQDPNYIALLVNGDGDLLTLTHIKDFNITAWSKLTTVGNYENVETIPRSAIDEPYVIVNRTINSVTKRYIEYMDFATGAQTQSAMFATSVTPTAVWSGLDYLEGMTVDILADGYVHPQLTVSGGSITLLYDASSVEIGIPYQSKITLLHPSVALPDGTSQGRTISVHEVSVRLQDTLGLWVNGEIVDEFRSFADDLNSQVSPFTGDMKIDTLGWESPQNLVIEQRIPMDFTVLGVIQKITIND